MPYLGYVKVLARTGHHLWELISSVLNYNFSLMVRLDGRGVFRCIAVDRRMGWQIKLHLNMIWYKVHIVRVLGTWLHIPTKICRVTPSPAFTWVKLGNYFLCYQNIWWGLWRENTKNCLLEKYLVLAKRVCKQNAFYKQYSKKIDNDSHQKQKHIVYIYVLWLQNL